MFEEKSWEEVRDLAEHYKAIGCTRIYLHDTEFPWHLMRKIEAGSTHRLDIATSVSCEAQVKGLELCWSFDIETRGANGSGSYQIDVEGIKRVMAKIPMDMKAQFSEYLSACADAVEKKGDEYQAAATRQYGDAVALRKAATSKQEVLG